MLHFLNKVVDDASSHRRGNISAICLLLVATLCLPPVAPVSGEA